MPLPPFITRVVLKNYKSIESCDVTLGPLTFLVGPNGSGKSNFLDAIHFVKDALWSSVAQALQDRGGVKEIAWRPALRPCRFGIQLDFQMPSDAAGHLRFELEEVPGRGFSIPVEECIVADQKIEKPLSAPGTLGSIYACLRQMGFYHVEPRLLREHQNPGSPDRLESDGRNAAGVLDRIAGTRPADKTRIDEYLGLVTRGIRGADHVIYGAKEGLTFHQSANGESIAFEAQSMSDGTLRALCVLIALFQSSDDGPEHVPLVGIEEPETALHPAALGALLDAMQEATERTQVIVTSHSADLLDEKDIPIESILAVESINGRTHIGHLDEASRSVLKRRLFTAGELLRMNQLQPEPAAQLSRKG